MEKHVVYVPKVGTSIDCGIGTKYITKYDQKVLIEREIQRWKDTIKCPNTLNIELCDGDEENPLPHLKTEIVPNPYFGWSEKQLKIKYR
jgi:hypothetical protein